MWSTVTGGAYDGVWFTVMGGAYDGVWLFTMMYLYSRIALSLLDAEQFTVMSPCVM